MEGRCKLSGSNIFPAVALAGAAHPPQIMTRSHFNVEAGLVIAMLGDGDDGSSDIDNNTIRQCQYDILMLMRRRRSNVMMRIIILMMMVAMMARRRKRSTKHESLGLVVQWGCPGFWNGLCWCWTNTDGLWGANVVSWGRCLFA